MADVEIDEVSEPADADNLDNDQPALGGVVYDLCTVRELKSFAAQRGLKNPGPLGLRASRYYLALLRKADRHWHFRFLDLPLELRFVIYRELLICENDKVIVFETEDHENHYYEGDPALCFPEILQACKQVHTEAYSVLYGENAIRCDVFVDFVPLYHGFKCLVHGELVERSHLNMIDQFPSFLRRIRRLKINLHLASEQGDAEENERQYQILRRILLTLTSFLVEGHQIKHLDVRIQILDDERVIASTDLDTFMHPIGDLRNIPNFRLLAPGLSVPLDQLQQELSEAIRGTQTTSHHDPCLRRWQYLASRMHILRSAAAFAASQHICCGKCPGPYQHLLNLWRPVEAVGFWCTLNKACMARFRKYLDKMEKLERQLSDDYLVELTDELTKPVSQYLGLPGQHDTIEEDKALKAERASIGLYCPIDILDQYLTPNEEASSSEDDE